MLFRSPELRLLHHDSKMLGLMLSAPATSRGNQGLGAAVFQRKELPGCRESGTQKPATSLKAAMGWIGADLEIAVTLLPDVEVLQIDSLAGSQGR